MKRIRFVVVAVVAAGLVVAGLLAFRRGPALAVTDFAVTPRSTTPVYDAALAPAGDARVKEFRIPIYDRPVTIADSVTFAGWTFAGSIPGPVVRVRQGDRVRIVLVNDAMMPHSIDFHAARIAPNVAFRMVMPHDSLTFEFTATEPGAFLVHCGTAPISLHLLQGMYLPIIVDPAGGWPTKADEEFVIVQSEFYTEPGPNGQLVGNYPAETRREANYVVFNGRAFQYKEHPLQVHVGDRVRFFVVNAGPNFTSDFHVVGTIFDRVYPDGNPAHALEGVQTYPVPAGGGVVFETHFSADGSGEGVYPFVTHAFSDAEKGALGLIRVGNPPGPMALGH